MAPDRSILALLFALVAALPAGSCAEAQNDHLPLAQDGPPAAPSDRAVVDTRPDRALAQVVFGADTVTAEVARTDQERARGLMYRESLAPNAGMLFVFPEQSVRSFWMQNTYIDLDIAFMDRDFRVVDIQQMDAQSTDSHVSRARAMYALETNQGWFEAHGVQIGDRPSVTFGR